MLAIIGPNGAGKTTMMDIITGKTRPDDGEVFFDGTDRPDQARRGRDRQCSASAASSRSRRCSRATPSEDNLELALKRPRGVFPTLFHRRSADDDARASTKSSRPSASADKRDELAADLSHGQKQWLEIGMLLAQDPKLLLVDEPVAGMTDAETERDGRAAQGHRQDPLGGGGRARHEFRARARRQGDLPAEGSVLPKARSITSPPTSASSKSIWGDEHGMAVQFRSFDLSFLQLLERR